MGLDLGKRPKTAKFSAKFEPNSMCFNLGSNLVEISAEHLLLYFKWYKCKPNNGTMLLVIESVVTLTIANARSRIIFEGSISRV